MRTIILSIVTVLAVYCPTFTQGYQSIFGADTTQWNYLTDYKRADWISTDIYVSFNDTIIDEAMYHELHETLAWNITSQLGFIREDTIEGKTWLRYLDDTIDFLVMDLSLELGDTFVLKSKHTAHWDVVCTVEEIIKQDSRKTIILDGLALNEDLTFVEGIGTNYTFQVFDYLGYSQLLCAYKDSELVFNNPEFDSCFVDIGLSVPHKESVDFQVTYNSILNTISIRSKEMLPHTIGIQLLDLYGRTILTEENHCSQMNIQLPRIIPGIYILLVNGKSHKIVINVN